MTRRAGTLTLRLKAAALLGGHTAPPPGVDAATATRVDLDDPTTPPRPFIPASAVRGALREAVSRLAVSEGLLCCSLEEPCRADPCAVCRLFGMAGVDRPQLASEELPAAGRGWMLRRLRLSDAELRGEARLLVRHGVAVDRRSGHAARGKLFQRRVVQPDDTLTFVATWRGAPTVADFALLQRAMPLLTSVGGGRSRGLGHVEASLDVVSAGTGVSPNGSGLDLPGKDIRPDEPIVVRLVAVEPLHLGTIPDPTSFGATERTISGAALKGALAAALLRAGVSENSTGFRSLIVSKEAHFSDLLPCRDHDDLPFAIPRTAVACTDCGQHIEDRVLQEAVAAALVTQAAVAAPAAACPRCRAPLRPVAGTWPEVALRSRLVTRLARDPRTGAYAYGRLYAREQLEPGCRFAGTSGGLPAAALDTMRDLANGGEPVYVGGMRSRGLGAVRVRIEPWTDNLGKRLRVFRLRAEKTLRSVGDALGWTASALVQVVAVTPLDVSVRPGSSSAVDLGRQLFGDRLVEVRGQWVRRVARSGWDDYARPGPRPVRWVLAPGSCWLFEVPGEVSIDRLMVAETAGVGGSRELGMGRVRLAPQLHQGTR